jgi:hypothetical protein
MIFLRQRRFSLSTTPFSPLFITPVTPLSLIALVFFHIIFRRLRRPDDSAAAFHCHYADRYFADAAMAAFDSFAVIFAIDAFAS